MTGPRWLLETIDQHKSGSTAVEDVTKGISYAELSDQTRSLAGRLRSQLGPGWPVVVLAERSEPSTVQMLLALWADGRVPLFLAPSTPSARVAAAIQVLRPAAVIRDGTVVATDDNAAPNPLEGCPDPAYLVLTSGSTSEPKLVLCRWRGLEVVARELVQRYRISASSRVLQFASPAYDAYLAETVPVLLAGGTVVCCDDAEWTTPRRLAQAMSSRRVTHATFPPSYLKQMVAQAQLPFLEVLISAGEALDASLGAEARRHSDLLVNAYGPCETTICATTYEVRGDEDEIPLGSPLTDVQVDAVDGLLRISGPTVGWGYLSGRPADPGFTTLPDGREAFMSGDLCVIRDGRLLYRGRSDRQQKVLGHRVDLTAVEHAIRSIPLVADCVVVMRGGEMAVAVVTSGNLADIQRAARDLLPAPERPRHWRVVGAIPHLVSDKLDLTAVLGLFDRPHGGVGAPPTDADLAATWRRHAPLSHGEDTDFFAVGGDSLKAMALLDDVHSTTGVDLDLADFIAEPTFGNILRLIGQRQCDD
jgi:acyl-coenzyme A synthetase/AMP-(fatty) acid ligase